jgi:F-type H+-transporting ATPase subunit b
MAHDAEVDALHAEIDGLPQLDFATYTPQIFWMVMVFSLLYIVFSKKILPDISGVIENRKNHIQSNLDSAEKITSEADTVHDAYNEGLKKAQTAAGEAIQKAELKMKSSATTAMDEFRERSNKEVQETEDRIVTAKIKAMGDMNAIAAEAASVAVEKIIGTTDENKVKAIVENMNGKAKAA